MAIIDSRGLVDDGTAGLQVQGQLSTAGVQQSPTVLAGTANVNISNPGFYQVAASGSGGVGVFTGSVPSPATFPGGMLGIVDTLNINPFLMSGVAGGVVSGQKMFISPQPIYDITGSAMPPKVGGSVTCTKGSSLQLVSDGLRWMVMAGSGSFTFNSA